MGIVVVARLGDQVNGGGSVGGVHDWAADVSLCVGLFYVIMFVGNMLRNHEWFVLSSISARLFGLLVKEGRRVFWYASGKCRENVTEVGSCFFHMHYFFVQSILVILKDKIISNIGGN
uniref:Uncharacterized protein n=1 Tax=Corethron hystrix TaxID=216773 RepID=A0A7S1BPU4_9STRA